MQSPGTPLSHSIESVAARLFYGKLPESGSSWELLDSANLKRLREDAYAANSAKAENTIRARVVAWSVGRSALTEKTDNESTDRLEAVLRLPFVLNSKVTPATLEVREFLEPELSYEERRARLAKHPLSLAGMYTTYRTNPSMTQLVVKHGLLTIDPSTNLGRPSSSTYGVQFDQPLDEHIPDYLPVMQTDRLLADIDAGRIGNLLVATEEDAAAFENELSRGAEGKHTVQPSFTVW